MTSGCLIFPPIIDHNVMRLDRITLLPYRPLAGRYLLSTVRMQIFGIFLVVPADPAIEQLLTGLLFVIPAVYVLCIVELLKAPVIAAFLLFIDWCCSVPWLKTAHDISIVDMRFFYRQLPPAFFCAGTISDMDLFIRKQRFYFMVQFPSHGSHICFTFKRLDLRLPVPEFAAGLMVRRCMAFFTDCDHIAYAVRAALAPVFGMVCMQDRMILNRPTTALAGVIIPGKDRFTQRGDAIAFSLLIILYLWQRASFFESL